MKIFISYASNDFDVAEQVYYGLLGIDHEVGFDRARLEAGFTYTDTLAAEIEASDYLVFLISPHSVTPGRYTLSELQIAKGKWAHPEGGVLPVLVAETDYATIDNYLKAVTILEPVGSVAAEVVQWFRSLDAKRRELSPTLSAATKYTGLSAVTIVVVTILGLLALYSNLPGGVGTDHPVVTAVGLFFCGVLGGLANTYIAAGRRKSGTATAADRLLWLLLSGVFGVVFGWGYGYKLACITGALWPTVAAGLSDLSHWRSALKRHLSESTATGAT